MGGKSKTLLIRLYFDWFSMRASLWANFFVLFMSRIPVYCLTCSIFCEPSVPFFVAFSLLTIHMLTTSNKTTNHKMFRLFDPKALLKGYSSSSSRSDSISNVILLKYFVLINSTKLKKYSFFSCVYLFIFATDLRRVNGPANIEHADWDQHLHAGRPGEGLRPTGHYRAHTQNIERICLQLCGPKGKAWFRKRISSLRCLV